MAHSAAPSHNATRLCAVTAQRPPSVSLHTGAVLYQGRFRARMEAMGGEGGLVEEEGGEERRGRSRVLPLTGMIGSNDSEINGLRVEKGWSTPSSPPKRHFCATCELSKCQRRNVWRRYVCSSCVQLEHVEHTTWLMPLTRLFCKSWMSFTWQKANISAPADDQTAAAGHLDSLNGYWRCYSFVERGERKVVFRTVSPAAAAGLSYPFLFFTSILSLCQAMLFHPWDPDRHPTITPSHDPELFFFPRPSDTFLSILTVQRKRPEGRRER